jgi:ATP-dependent exoDNAse (exonuclease V) beta subunit
VERVLDLAERYKPMKKLKDFEQLNEVGSARKERLVARAAAAVALPYAATLRELHIGYGRLYQQLKQAAGVLDFEDLQKLAANLLDRRPEIAARYRERFKVVMIDEFQDTDALQLRLVEQIAGKNLCTVGDEMQAIYGFRGADVDVYRRHRAAMRQAGALVAELATNYRSHPEILGFVNGVFGSEHYGKNDTLPLKPAPGGREPQSLDSVLRDQPRVEVLFVDAGAESLGSARKREAAEIAERLAELKERGLVLGDVAILLRAYTDAHIYADALAQRGLAATVVGGGRFFGLAETAIMRALTRVIASVADEAALGVLLVSEFVPIADEALLQLRMAAAGQPRSLWELMSSDLGLLDPADAEALRGLRAVIERARTRVGREPLEDLLLKAVEEAGWDLRLLARGNMGRDAFVNVAKFVRRAAEFERREGSGAAGFSAHLDAKERLGDHESPDSAINEGASAVQIMSIHASKGLEFPVVVVPDIGRGGRNNCSIIRTKRTPSELLVAMKTPPKNEAGESRAGSEWFGEFDREDKASVEEERDRVFYVALTRARDLLMVSGAGKLNPAKRSEATDDLVKLARTLGLGVPIGEPLEGPITFDGTTVGHLRVISSGAGEGVKKQDSAQPIDALPLRFGEPLCTARPAVWLPESVSFTQLSEFECCPRQFRIRRILQIAPHAPVATSGLEPMRLGTALHSALRLVSPNGGPPDEGRMRSLMEYFELDADQAVRLADATRRYCASDIAKRAYEAETVMHEAPFSISLGGELFVLGGSVDLLARSGASALIVDYKSGVSGDPETLSDRYRLQAECYALAALKDGCTEVEVAFVRPEVTSDGQVEQVSFRFGVDEAQRIEAKLVDQYRDIQASDYRPTPGDACANCCVPTGMCEHRAPSQTRRRAGPA